MTWNLSMCSSWQELEYQLLYPLREEQTLAKVVFTLWAEKCNPLSFAILIIWSLTKSLQSTPLV